MSFTTSVSLSARLHHCDVHHCFKVSHEFMLVHATCNIALEGDLANFAFWFQETQYDIERHRAFRFLPDSVALL